MLRCLAAGVATLTLTAVAGASPQGSVSFADRYETLYGDPVDGSLDTLLWDAQSYDGRAVRTRERLELASRDGVYALGGGITRSVIVIPMPEIAYEFDAQVMSWLGQTIEVTGVFYSGSGPSGVPGSGSPTIQFWAFVGPEAEEEEGPAKATDVRLETLVTSPGGRDGQTIRVVGKFRGRNLYGDLPVRSARHRDGWIIKDDLFAVWVTGKKPKGKGWELDPTLKRDTNKWLAVVGRPETHDGITYVHASRVALSEPPTAAAAVQEPPAPPPQPKEPPIVVFALPLDGEQVAPDTRFTVQFSKDMQVSSFEGRVVLRYAGRPMPGDREFTGVTLSYDGGRRALTVDPGDLLRAGREVELLLLPGIQDVDGLTLEPRPGKDEADAVDVLHYFVTT